MSPLCSSGIGVVSSQQFESTLLINSPPVLGESFCFVMITHSVLAIRQRLDFGKKGQIKLH